LLFLDAVKTIPVLFIKLAKFAQVIVDRVNGVTVAFVTALKVLPFVGQAETPVNVLIDNCALLVNVKHKNSSMNAILFKLLNTVNVGSDFIMV